MPLHLLPGVRLQISLTKAQPKFYLINKCVDSKIIFKCLYAQLLVRRVRPNHTILLAHNSTLSKGSLARYNLKSDELKTFHSRRYLNTCLLTKLSCFPSGNVSCSPWLSIQILSLRFRATRKHFSITASVTFRCLSTVNSSLTRAYLLA